MKYEHKRNTPNVRDTKYDHIGILKEYTIEENYNYYGSAWILLKFKDRDYEFFIHDDAKIKTAHNAIEEGLFDLLVEYEDINLLLESVPLDVTEYTKIENDILELVGDENE